MGTELPVPVENKRPDALDPGINNAAPDPDNAGVGKFVGESQALSGYPWRRFFCASITSAFVITERKWP